MRSNCLISPFTSSFLKKKKNAFLLPPSSQFSFSLSLSWFPLFGFFCRWSGLRTRRLSTLQTTETSTSPSTTTSLLNRLASLTRPTTPVWQRTLWRKDAAQLPQLLSMVTYSLTFLHVNTIRFKVVYMCLTSSLFLPTTRLISKVRHWCWGNFLYEVQLGSK